MKRASVYVVCCVTGEKELEGLRIFEVPNINKNSDLKLNKILPFH